MKPPPITTERVKGPGIGGTNARSALAEAPERAEAGLRLLLDGDTFRPWRSAVGDAVAAGSGRLGGRRVFVWAQDQSQRGGSLGGAGGDTIARTIRRADRARAPVVGLAASAGARLQEGTGALTAYADIFRAQALAEVPQVTLIVGTCAGGAAYSSSLGDFTITAGDKARLFLTGPGVVEEVTRERVTPEELGGHSVHARNGVAQLHAEDEAEAGALACELIAHLPDFAGGPLPLAPPREPNPGDPAAPLPASPRRVYDVRDVIGRLVDGGHLLEFSRRWARNMVVGLARLDGLPVGVIANQPHHLGGTIDAAGAEKGAWFVRMCDRFRLPLVVLVDTPGFLPGVGQEQRGVIRHGAGLLDAFASATVTRVTVTMRQAYGGAHIVMNSRDLGADLTLAWPGSAIGVMGARQAVGVIERRAIERGADPDALATRYADRHLDGAFAAQKGYVDEIVEPAETRSHLIEAMEGVR
jgi:acetyl-CoA carboxylase carboxyltransferase component